MARGSWRPLVLVRALRVVTLAWLGATSALAAEPGHERVRLAWVRALGAESCISEAELARRVREKLGRDPFDDGAERVIEGRFTHVSSSWAAEIRVRGADGSLLGERAIESQGEDCSALTEATVLAVVLTIDPDAGAAPTSPAPPPPAPTIEPAPPGPQPAPPICPKHEPARCPERQPLTVAPPAPETQGTLTLRGLAALGVLPRPAFGAGVAGDYSPLEHFHFTIGLSYLPEVETDDGEFAFGLTAASAGACVDALASGAAALAVCAELSLGSMHAVVYRLTPERPGDRIWLAAAAGPRLTLELVGPMLAELGASAQVPIIRQNFVVEGRAGQAFQPAALAGFGYLGLGVRIP